MYVATPISVAVRCNIDVLVAFTSIGNGVFFYMTYISHNSLDSGYSFLSRRMAELTDCRNGVRNVWSRFKRWVHDFAYKSLIFLEQGSWSGLISRLEVVFRYYWRSNLPFGHLFEYGTVHSINV